MRTTFLAAAALATALAVLAPISGGRAETLLRDDFFDLTHWKPLTLPGIEARSEYSAKRIDTGYALHAQSNASASGLMHRQTWDVHEYPYLRFRWKVDAVITAGDATRKEGDDFALRIYVIFGWDEENMSLGDRLTRAMAKMFSEGEPPHSCLVYVWANRRHAARFFPNPFTARAMVFPLRHGCGDCGQWLTEQVDIAADYRAAFGQEPPRTAALAVMSDSDNTQASGSGWLDFIEVTR